MGVGVFAKVVSRATPEEFVEVLKIATDVIKLKKIGFNKRTNVKSFDTSFFTF